MTGVSFMSASSDAVLSDISVMTEIRERQGEGQRLLMVNAAALMSQPTPPLRGLLTDLDGRPKNPWTSILVPWTSHERQDHARPHRRICRSPVLPAGLRTHLVLGHCG